MNVGLYLMTEKGESVLDAALQSGVEIAHVTTAEAKGINDDAHVRIAAQAKANGIPTFTLAHPPDYTGEWSIAAGWRWMLDVPNLVVLHDSILPRYRGFSPLITALVQGEPEVGVTAFMAVDEPDSGPIVAQRRIPVSYPVRMREVLIRLNPLYADLAFGILIDLQANGQVRYTAQDHSLATYSVWRDEDDYRIDWTKDDRTICRLIDAASDPHPGAWTARVVPPLHSGWERDGELTRIPAAVPVTDKRIEDRCPGKVFQLRDGNPVVVCGTGMVLLPDGPQMPLRTRFV